MAARRLWRPGLLAVGLGLLLPTVASADACRDAFVACVAETGNVPGCSSVSRSCMLGATGEQINTRELDLKRFLFGRDGHRWIQVTIRNPNVEDVPLSNHTEQLRCIDGSTFIAHFRFEGAILEGQETVQSEPQIVCPGAEFMALGERESGDIASDADQGEMSGARYACNPNDPQAPAYSLTSIQSGRVEATSGNLRVIFDLSDGTVSEFHKTLCVASEPGTDWYQERIARLRDLLDSILPAVPDAAPSTRSTTTGVRN